ncbi:hydantoinase [Bordetella genomosp. 10]|uniref:Hydantoinase n=1 Tax=Bordetella genomosp. 10 TaxID=1416804 RepID=A0A261SI95_9BORD|nr:hydantoinase/oxoprolinase family protein [Bordetella genomosp. 10]OZI37106.1 hydantoinase [Bordetella genomosp. 10]
MAYRIGVDIGGSFTDFALFDEETQTLKSLKTFSRPDQPGAEVMTGIALAEERYGIKPRDISYFTHGTTVGINTVIQRKGLKLALFATEGFRDVLEIGRLKIADMYNLLSKRPEPLIPRDMVFGIPGRLDAAGEELEPLDEDAVKAAVKAAQAAKADGIVVSLLHSYRNPAHEMRVKDVILSVAPGMSVFCSSVTWPIIREYERTVTTVIGGYVQPRVAQYLGSLQKALAEAGVRGEPRLTKSNGGVMTAEQGKQDCVQMILSGTASGVIGAAYVAKVAGIDRCMSLDIGGTSADVAIIIDGAPQYGVGELIGEFQIYIPSVSVSSIGEGGGSIAWVDGQNVLRVGPESAGSTPGPACYGRGGTRATITDAFVAMGAIGHSDLGYNAVKVDREASRRVVGELAEKLKSSVEETAEAIVNIAVSGMYTDTSALISRFGIDPREFSLLGFGGAGPMLACFLARELRMKEVVIPTTPGVLSALGGLIADVKNDFLSTVYVDAAPASMARIAEEFDALEARAVHWLREGQGYRGDYELIPSAEMRYRGQSFEIDTRLDVDAIRRGDMQALIDAFHQEHKRLYGHADPEAAVQVISIRLVISGKTIKPEFPRLALDRSAATPKGHVRVWMDGAPHDAAHYWRADLKPGQYFGGPAIVAQEDCTTVVPPGYAARVDAYGNLRITEGEQA